MTSEEKKSKPRSWKKLVFGFVLFLILGAGATAFYIYLLVFGVNVSKSLEARSVLFSKNSSLEEQAEQLKREGILLNVSDFLRIAAWMNFEGKSGRYTISSEVKSNRDLIRLLRGAQSPMKFVFHNLRQKEQLPGLVAQKIQADSNELLALFRDEDYLQSLGFNSTSIATMFIPNTYELYWDTDAEGFMQRMKKEHERFWNQERLAKAQALELSPEQVYILASIVETETQYNPEKPRIAGVYLNRLRKGWKLEADPTVVFAHGDFTLRRVLHRHLEIDSPYNTYRYEGLPPGPIYLASIPSIDAVLNAERHDYMFFCAYPDNSGAHAFAKTLSQHTANARAYHRWLNSRGR